jgi:hypothetical protein
MFLIIMVALATSEAALVPPVKASRRETIIYSTRENKWTLLIQAHAPRYGETSGQAHWGYRADFYIGPFSTYSSVSHSDTLLPTNGQCMARFQLCRWEYRCVFVEQGPFNGHSSWYEDRWIIIQRFDQWYTTNIYGGSTSTCSDDLEFLSAYGYESNTFNSRYMTQDRGEINDADDWHEHTVTADAFRAIGAAISVSVEVNYYTGTGTFGVTNTWFSTWTYKYRFGPHHAWYCDYLGSTQCIWAFHTRW